MSDTRVLIADDNLALATVIRFCLESAGFRVEVAHDGRRACELASEEKFDLFILDHQMPEMDGPTCCRTLRRDSRYSETPVIVASAKCDEPIERAQWHGLNVAQFFGKPFSPQKLVDVSRALAESAHTRSPQNNRPSQTDEATI